MKYLIVLIGLIIAVAMLAGAPAFTIAMQGEDHISKTEEQETLRIAQLFLQRFEQTRDINPILDEMFVADFSDRLLTEPGELSYIFDIEPELAPKIKPAEFRRFYAAMLNEVYLGGLYILSKYPPESFESLNEKEVWPPDIWKLLVSNSYLAHIFNEEAEETTASERTISNLEQLRSITDTVEKVNALMRKYVDRSRAGQTRHYRENLMDLKQRFEGCWMKPGVWICDRNCFGFPKGTRLFYICVPPLIHLILARVDGEMKIVAAMIIGD